MELVRFRLFDSFKSDCWFVTNNDWSFNTFLVVPVCSDGGKSSLSFSRFDWTVNSKHFYYVDFQPDRDFCYYCLLIYAWLWLTISILEVSSSSLWQRVFYFVCWIKLVTGVFNLVGICFDSCPLDAPGLRLESIETSAVLPFSSILFLLQYSIVLAFYAT